MLGKIDEMESEFSSEASEDETQNDIELPEEIHNNNNNQTTSNDNVSNPSCITYLMQMLDEIAEYAQGLTNAGMQYHLPSTASSVNYMQTVEENEIEKVERANSALESIKSNKTVFQKTMVGYVKVSEKLPGLIDKLMESLDRSSTALETIAKRCTRARDSKIVKQKLRHRKLNQ